MGEKFGTRINKYLSEIGFCSRREADKLIEDGRVTLNGKIPEMGVKVGRKDKVRVDGRLVSEPEEDPVYLAFNKPVGIVCTTDTKTELNNIIDYINYPIRIFPIGRLDKPSEGLIFLTNDGDIVNKILRAGNSHEKEYEVSVNKPVTDDFIRKMSSGIPILGVTTRKCKVEKTGAFSFRIILTQGLNRQIRRMCEFLGYEVKRLKRVRIMNISLDLQVGHWREWTEEELTEMQKMLADSSKTAKAPKTSHAKDPDKIEPSPPRKKNFKPKTNAKSKKSTSKLKSKSTSKPERRSSGKGKRGRR